MVRLRINLSYDGTDFSGWAKQPGKRTVQGELESSLKRVIDLCGESRFDTVVAGRTDAGVHALSQTVHFDIEENIYSRLTKSVKEHKSFSNAEGCIKNKLSGVLSEDIFIKDVTRTYDEFSARFSAVSRSYVYQIADTEESKNPFVRKYSLFEKQKLDEDLMNEAARNILGLHDFSAFVKSQKENDNSTNIRNLIEFVWERDEKTGLLRCHITADAFAHNMVRSLVNASVFIGRGRKPVTWLKDKLNSGEREGKTGPAVAKGLFLANIEYPQTREEIIKQNDKAKARRSKDEIRG